MKFPTLMSALFASSWGAQAAGVGAFEGNPAVNQGADFENQDSVEGFHVSNKGGLNAEQVCTVERPRPCPDGRQCCSDAYPWCCPSFCCPNGYRYCGTNGRCYANP